VKRKYEISWRGALAAVAIVFSVTAQAVTLGWDPSTGAAGYKLYYGTTSSNYTSVVDAGNSTSNRVTGLQVGTKYYFAVSAYTPSGESALSSEISFTPTNTAPVISPISDVTINKNLSTAPIGFTVQDVESAASTLTVQASSGNTTLLPNSRIALAGTGTNRTIALAPAANQSGAVTVTLTVGDGALTSTRTFVLTVTASNNAPAVQAPASLNLAKEGSVPVTGVVLSDPDSNTGSYTLLLQATYGTIQISTGVSGGVSAAQVVGNGSSSVQVSARLTALNATLAAANGLTYTGPLNFVGSDTLLVTVNDNGNTGTGGPLLSAAQIAVNVTGSSLDSWKMAFFSYTDLSDPAKAATVWDDKADPDGDGMDNLFEYAVGLNPTNREAMDANVSSTLIDVSGTKYSGLSYVRRKNQTLIQYIPEVSADKVAWTSGSAAVRENSVVSLDSTFERVNCQDLTPISAGSPRFIRLRVVKP